MFVRSLSAALFSLLLVPPAFAQSTLSGTVRDASGAVVPGTTIVIRHAGSAFERLVESGRDGRFDVTPIAGAPCEE